jgi:Zn-dependent M28 family amino/carboxypeptidase
MNFIRPRARGISGFTVLFWVFAGMAFGQSTPAKVFNGAAALNFTAKAVAFGPRPSGSPANVKLRAYIHAQLAGCGCQVSSDSFTAQTPDGPLAMENIVAKFPGKSGRAIAITGHFDTKKMTDFVGANDGGSSTGILLEMAAVLAGRPRIDDVYLVFFDGEEAVRDWTATDSVYGSRHLAYKWKADGTLGKIKALINVDMIGDKSLDILIEEYSTNSLRQLVWKTAADLGYAAFFLNSGEKVEDDHMPFLQLGVPSLDLIDFDYDPWHKDSDTMDKLSPKSLEIVGTVVLESVKRLERQ